MFCLTALVLGSLSSPPATADAARSGEANEIDALVAPVALYPDRLLAKVLVASTYPLEVAEAAKWLQLNGGSPHRAGGGILQKQRWDASIKDLACVPRLIVMMNDHLDWTQNLGDAFLSRPAAVMKSVQTLRTEAVDKRFLRSNGYQNVVRIADDIEIQPLSTDQVHLPYYDPHALYAASKLPARLQPSWAPAPGYRYEGKNSFLPGVQVPASVWNTSVAWDEAGLYVNRQLRPGNRANPVRPPDRVVWKHDPAHRRGVNYSTAELRARYGQQSPSGADERRAFRGFSTGAQPPAFGPSDVQGGLRDASYEFNKHGGALDGVGDGAKVGAFSKRGHGSLSANTGSAKPKSENVLLP